MRHVRFLIKHFPEVIENQKKKPFQTFENELSGRDNFNYFETLTPLA